MTLSSRAYLRLVALHQPFPRGVFLRGVEMLDVCMHEMLRDMRHDDGDAAVRNHGDLFNFLMMLLDESQVRHQCAEVFPAGKLRRAYQDAMQYSVVFEIGIDV